MNEVIGFIIGVVVTCGVFAFFIWITERKK